MLTPTGNKVIGLLERVTETEEVRLDPDIALFDLGILDSFALVELVLALEAEFGIEIAPAEIEREQWASPHKIITFVENRVRA